MVMLLPHSMTLILLALFFNLVNLGSRYVCKSGGVSFKDRESAYPFQISKMKFMLSFLFFNFQLTRGKNGTIFQQSVMLEGAFRFI